MPFNDDQIAALRAKLDPSHVKARKQGGTQVSYVEGWHAIAEANRIFGFDAWDRETAEIRLVSENPCRIGVGTKYEKDGFRVGYIAKVRVRVRAGDTIVIREGTGYGSGIDADLGAAHESAIKEAETDAMKRALMTFGNPFGLALYDKTRENVGTDEPGHGHATNGSKPAPLPWHLTPEGIAEFEREIERKLGTVKDLDALDMLWRNEAGAKLREIGPVDKLAQHRIVAHFSQKKAELLTPPPKASGKAETNAMMG